MTAAAQSTHSDTSSANTNITAAAQSTDSDTSSANANITAAPQSQHDTLSGPLRTRSPLWRALRRYRKRLRTLANGCGRLRTQTQNLANTASPPDPQVKREPSLRIREKQTDTNEENTWKHWSWSWRHLRKHKLWRTSGTQVPADLAHWPFIWPLEEFIDVEWNGMLHCSLYFFRNKFSSWWYTLCFFFFRMKWRIDSACCIPWFPKSDMVCSGLEGEAGTPEATSIAESPRVFAQRKAARECHLFHLNGHTMCFRLCEDAMYSAYSQGHQLVTSDDWPRKGCEVVTWNGPNIMVFATINTLSGFMFQHVNNMVVEHFHYTKTPISGFETTKVCCSAGPRPSLGWLAISSPSFATQELHHGHMTS